MKEQLEEIYQNTIPHHSFLDKRSIDSCMYQSYMLGKQENIENYNKLKSAFLDLLKTGDHKVEEWKKTAGIL
jgi:hypothetical protein